MYPKASTNLNKLLRDPKFGYGDKSGARLQTLDAWAQLLGVCSALRMMHEYDSGYGDYAGRGHTCIHFDLKPDNILIERQTGNWLLTDFGQAALTESQSDTIPRVGGHFGTDAYAPPENDDTSMPFGPAYDIWSLGCIILEVTAFAVRGHDGLTGTSTMAGLDQVRKSVPTWARNQDERFFCLQRLGGGYIVKKEIAQFMDDLPSGLMGETDDLASSSFLLRLIVLINRMLRPQPKDRMGIFSVVDILASALNVALIAPLEQKEHVVVEVANNEVVLGGPQVRQIKLWHGSKKYGWKLSNMEVLGNYARVMRLYCWGPGRKQHNVTFRRRDVKMVPF